MSFFDKAKAAATDLAAKADTAMQQAGLQPPPLGGGGRDADRLLRDLGVLTWRETTGETVSVADRERVLGELRRLADSGQLGSLELSHAAGAVPPPPGAAAAGSVPPPPGAAAAAASGGQEGYAGPPAGASAPPASAGQTAPEPIPPGSTPPPPPPSWA